MSEHEPLLPLACDERMSALAVSFSHRGKRYATLVAKVVARLMENATAIVLSPSPLVLRDEHANPEQPGSLIAPCEIAPRLLACDVVFRGSAFQPPDMEGPSRGVGLGLHRDGQPLMHKLLYVYGDRLLGLPKSFRRMPIEWERAFGGPDYELNPVGCGLLPDGSAPNIVDPRNGRYPAGFGALSRNWPIRAKLVGQHALTELEGTQLSLPDDVPFAFFQCAPYDQRMRFLFGDEWLVLDGLHPIAPRFQARLPALRAVAQLHRRGEQSAPASSPMNLDMLSIDGDTLRISCVFRQSFELEAALDEYVAVIGVASEGEAPHFPPRPPFLRSAVAEPGPAQPSLRDTFSLGPATQRAAGHRPATPYGDAPPRAGVVAEAPGAPWVGPAPPVPLPKPGESTLRLAVEQAPAELRALNAATAGLAQPSQTKPPIDAAARDLPFFAAKAIDVEEAAPLSVAPPMAPASMRFPPASAPDLASPPRPPGAHGADAPASEASEPEVGVRRIVLDKVAAGDPLHGIDLVGSDLSGLDLSRAVLSGANLTHAKLSGAKLEGATLSGAKLGSADLRAASLGSADLSGADLSRATLDGADFTDATLDDANLSLASAVGCSFKGARARRVRLSQARCEGAMFDAADLTGADATSAELGGASLIRTTLSDARLGNARLDGATMHDTALDGAALNGASLRDVAADGADFSRASLEAADFTHAHLHRARFVSAQLVKAKLDGVDARACDFTTAILANATAVRAVFEGASFAGADVRGARFLGADLQRTNLTRVLAQKLVAPEANLQGADLSSASLRFAKLSGANLEQAKLVECDLRDADLEGAKLSGSDRTKARMAGANVKRATGIDDG